MSSDSVDELMAFFRLAGDQNDGAEFPAARLPDPSRLIVEDWAGEENSFAALSPAKMAELGIGEDDTVLLKGRIRRETVCAVAPDEDCPDDTIRLNRIVRDNLRVRVSDAVSARRCPELPHGELVFVAPLDDTVAGLATAELDGHLRRHFAAAPRPVHGGDRFVVRAGARALEFKVAGTTPPPYCRADADTAVQCGRVAVKRADEEAALAEPGYDDVGGCARQLARIRETVELPLLRPELFEAAGVAAPRGLLLHGPPGAGKTLIARALANETGAFSVVINGPEIMGKYYGEAEGKLRDAFAEAAGRPPAIIFIDEIDSIAPKRDRTPGECERRVVATLLTLFNGVGRRVVVVAATNRPDSIDGALRRPGRLDREVRVGAPDAGGRLEVLRAHTRRMRLAGDVDLARIAERAHGLVGADLAHVCLEAGLRRIRRATDGVDLADDAAVAAAASRIQVTAEDFALAMAEIGPSALRETAIEAPRVTWDDVGGLRAVKRELQELVRYPVRHPDMFVKFGLEPSRGLLLYGPPGCGKTLLAKAVATECSANFISVKGSQLVSDRAGEGAANVRELFETARSAAPCVLFFDEIDSIARSRDASAAADRVTNQMLTEMDGVGAKKNVFVVAATNRPDMVDPAVLRPGRLDQLVYVPLPDAESREAVLRARLRRSPVAGDVDAGRIAAATAGFSGADLAEVCRRACRLAVHECVEAEEARRRDGGGGERDPVPQITREHFDEAMRYARRSVTDDDVRRYEKFARDLRRS